MTEFSGRLGALVESGALTSGEASEILRYPAAHERLENGEATSQRALKVARAWAADRARPRRPHHTRYNPRIIDAIESRVGRGKMILDPMAGTMERLSCLEKPHRGGHLVWGTELEPEWVQDYPHPRLIQADATDLPFDDAFFDAIVVSPSYGNRDADRTGDWWDNADRKTYASALGRNVSDESLCLPMTSEGYKRGHALAWCEAVRVLKPGGMFVINLKNFVAKGLVVEVKKWHQSQLAGIGLRLTDTAQIWTMGRHSGENADVRAENTESIFFYERPKSATAKADAVREWLLRGTMAPEAQ